MYVLLNFIPCSFHICIYNSLKSHKRPKNRSVDYLSIKVGLLRNEKNYGRGFFICYRINIDLSTM